MTNPIRSNRRAAEMDITEYVAEKGITAEIVEDFGQLVDEKGWNHHAYRMRLHRGTATIETPLKEGTGNAGSPADRPAELFQSLLMDATGYHSAESFEDYAEERQWDADSRAREKEYNALGEFTDLFITFVGGPAEFEYVAYEVEKDI